MRKGGTGGTLTKSGLHFESRKDLRKEFAKLTGYRVRENLLFFGKKLVAEMYRKEELYNKFLLGHGVNWKGLISARLLPDESIFVPQKKTLFVIEMKFQHVSGSVDEKLQTCDFKQKQYTKLLEPLGIQAQYIYVLSNWFRDSRYRDVLNYIRSVGCKYYFNNLPVTELGLPKPR